MSTIKLPPLPPEVDTVRALFRGQPDHFEAQDYYYTQDQMRAYAEEAVRQALAAQVRAHAWTLRAAAAEVLIQRHLVSGSSVRNLGWSGWACQYPGKLPRLYGAREIAELNCDTENGDRMLFLSEYAAPQTSECECTRKSKAVADSEAEL